MFYFIGSALYQCTRTIPHRYPVFTEMLYFTIPLKYPIVTPYSFLPLYLHLSTIRKYFIGIHTMKLHCKRQVVLPNLFLLGGLNSFREDYISHNLLSLIKPYYASPFSEVT